MNRTPFFIYGVACHVMFLAVYAYLMAFVGGFVVPRTIDSPVGTAPLAALAIDALLIAAFGVQHSVMARPAFKRRWTRLVPQPIERSTYVLVTNIILIVLFLFWQPIPQVVWHVENQPVRYALWGVFASGWLLVPVVTLLLNHFDLFGTRQVWLHLRGKPYEPLPFRTPSLYKRVRHPLYVGWLIAFWATPTMTAGHLLFAAGMTAYILIAIRFEERDLVAHFGEKYADYRRRTPMLLPRLRRITPQPDARPGSETAPVT